LLATALIFAYPQIYLYQQPFRKLTNLHYRLQPQAFTTFDLEHEGEATLISAHTTIQLKLFEHAMFFTSSYADNG
jgi:hypothetical protein